tara:strand:- start:547 stop:2214 length:1668 start_codon:yes stop_codon:yes gene_type:complete
MPHLGTQPPNGFSTSLKQSFSGDNSTTGFTLSRAASVVTDIQVFVDNIRQEPTSAYTVSGTTLTFTEAPPTGTNNVYVVHTNSQATGLLPPQDLGTTDYIFGDDISFNSDGAIINFGADSDVTLTHVHNTGLTLNTGITATTGTFSGAISTTSGTFTAHTTITTADNDNTLSLISTDADASEGPILRLMRDSSSPADGDSMGRIYFSGDNDAGEETQFVRFQSILSDASDGTEDGSFRIQTIQAGTNRSRMLLDPTETVFNDDSVDFDFRIESNNSANMFFLNGGTDRIGVGTGSPDAGLHIKGVSDHGTVIIESGGTSGSTNNTFIKFHNDGGNTISEITVEEDATNQGSIHFHTGGTTYAAVIDNSQNFFIGKASEIAGANGFQFKPTGEAIVGRAANDTVFLFQDTNGPTSVGSISITGSNTAYNTSSDYRLKENVVTDWDATSRLKQLKPSRFNFKIDKDTTIDGFLAHEVSSIVPEAITGEKDAMTKEKLYEDGDEIPDGKKVGDVKEASMIDPQGIDQSKLVPLLTKALQEAITKIETLETKVKALEDA